MKNQNISEQKIDTQKSVDNVHKLIKAVKKHFANLTSCFVAKPTKLVDGFTYTVSELNLPKIDLNRILMLRTSVFTPILDLHLGSYFTILNNPYTILY